MRFIVGDHRKMVSSNEGRRYYVFHPMYFITLLNILSENYRYLRKCKHRFIAFPLDIFVLINCNLQALHLVTNRSVFIDCITFLKCLRHWLHVARHHHDRGPTSKTSGISSKISCNRMIWRFCLLHWSPYYQKSLTKPIPNLSQVYVITPA